MGRYRFSECSKCHEPVLNEVLNEYKGRAVCDLCFEELLDLEAYDEIREKELAEDDQAQTS